MRIIIVEKYNKISGYFKSHGLYYLRNRVIDNKIQNSTSLVTEFDSMTLGDSRGIESNSRVTKKFLVKYVIEIIKVEKSNIVYN